MDVTSYTASDARQNLYSLIKTASTGLKPVEINLRGYDPVVLINKAELESWLETLDIMSNPEEVEAIRASARSKKFYTHEELKKELGI